MHRFGSQIAALVALALIASAGFLLVSSAAAPKNVPAAVGTERVAEQNAAPGPALLPNTAQAPTPTARPLDVTGLRVVVPRLGIDLPLDVGDPSRDVPRGSFAGGTPENFAFVFPTSRQFGDGGNTYIYAHARTGMFLALWKAQLGDEVRIMRQDGSVAWSYEVGVIQPRVDPSDTHWLEPLGPERVTLQTSTGPRPEDPRFIVVAYPRAGAQEGASPRP